MHKPRHLLITALAAAGTLLSPGQASAQSYLLNEGFEGAGFPPSGWTTVDADGDGHCWQIVTKGHGTFSGNQGAVSYTCNPDNAKDYGVEQDNWLITPQISVTNALFNLSYKCVADDLDSKEYYEVLVSETGTAPTDFTVRLKSETLDNEYEDEPLLNSRTLSLKQFEGKKIYIAFRHKMSGSYALGIDDVAVTNQGGPKAPTGLSVTADSKGAGVATLQWTNASADGTGAKLSALQAVIYRDNQKIATLSEGMTPGAKASFTDNAAPLGNHVYAVAMLTAEGESKTVTRSVYIGVDLPSPVTNLTATASAGRNHLSWTAPQTGANKGAFNPDDVSYTIVRTSGDNEETVATALRATSYDDTPQPGQLTSYTVVPVNAAGEGEPAVSGQLVCYDPSLKDLAVAADATSEFKNPNLPFDMRDNAGVMQTMVYPSELKNATGSISALVLRNSFPNTTKITKKLTVWLTETSEADLRKGWFATTDMTKVFDDSVTFVKGQNDVPLAFSAPYDYKGRNLVVYMQASGKGRGAYADRFFVKDNAGKEFRTRATSADDEGFDPDAIAPGVGTDNASAMPFMRFVIDAKGIATVSGKVTDAETGQPVAGASVVISDGKTEGETAESGNDGSWSIYAVKSGKLTVRAKAMGYDDFKADIDVPESGSTEFNIALSQRAKITVSGKALLGGADAPVGGIKVTLSGYSDGVTYTDGEGNFSFRAFKGEAGTLTFSYPLFESASVEWDAGMAEQDLEYSTKVLLRSPIPAYGTEAKVAADGSAVTVTWNDPASRQGKIQWTTIGKSDEHKDTNGDYYYGDDFYVAHAFTAQDTADSLLTSMSFTRLKAWVKTSKGTVTAMVWRGTKADHELLASAPLAATAEGGWATAEFDRPVEIRPGENYLVGLHLVGCDDDPVGTAAYGSRIANRNALKWSDKGTTYDGYYAWNLSALCAVPGSNGDYGTPSVALPQPSYSVYRTADSSDGSKAVLLKEGLTSRSFTDGTWATASPAAYTYVVKAVYPTAASTITSMGALSNSLERTLDTDAGVEAIVSPSRADGLQAKANISVRVKNYGEKPLSSVPVTVELSDGQSFSATLDKSLNKGETALLDVASDVALKPETFYTVKAFTKVEGDTFLADDTATIDLPNFSDVPLHGFRWDPYDYLGAMAIHPNRPDQALWLHDCMPNTYRISTADYYDGHVYAFTGEGESYLPREFVVLDTLTWTPVKSVAISNLVFDMTYDYTDSKMWAIVINNDKQALATVNLDNGSLRLVAPTDRSLSTLAADTRGTLYAIANDGVLYTVDKSSGETSAVGPTGVTDIQLYHSMTFDRRSGRLFWAHNGYESSGELYELNPATGAAQLLGTVMHDGYPSHTVGLYIPYDREITGINAATASAPSEGSILFDGTTATAPGAKAVTVTDIAGRTVIAAHGPKADLSALPHGLYIVRANGFKALKVNF